MGMNLKLFLLLILQLCITGVSGQYILETPDGKKVKLASNGTWVYIDSGGAKMKINQVPMASTAKYTSRLKKYEFWYDPKQWVIDTAKKTNSYTWDAYFFSKDYAIQGYCLDSRLSMPVESIEESIREQWQSTGEIKSFSSFNDTINHLPVTVFDLQYQQAGIVYMYKGLIYSDSRGSFQFAVGTQKEIFEEDRSVIELLLRGFTKK